MNKSLILFSILFLSFMPYKLLSQCIDYTSCESTGIFSPNDPAKVRYDNFVSGFHQSMIKQSSGSTYQVWGEFMGNNGSTSLLTPTTVNTTLYPSLTGTIQLFTYGGYTTSTLVILTSTGLFAVGGDYGYNRLFSSTIMPNANFRKLTINGKTDGLPTGVSPSQVRMMFGTGETLAITTCDGSVYVISQRAATRGNGATGNATTWYKVQKSAGVDLTNIIVCRGAGNTLYALDTSGNLWTWGLRTYLGNGTAVAQRNYATQMTLPVAGYQTKMIQATCQGPGSPAGGGNIIKTSYYVLGQDRTLYALGSNTNRQLGDFTTTERTTWVPVKKPDNTNYTDAAWISTQEHDGADVGFSFFGSLSVLTSSGKLSTNGNSNGGMIGRGDIDNANPGLPTGITASDVITVTEIGGHTSMVVKDGVTKLGYVGHRILGSMGDGTTVDAYETTFNFSNTPVVSICGTTCSTTLTSAVGTNTQTLCQGSLLTTITYSLTGLNITNATVSPLPTGVTASYSNGVVTISGTPTQSGTFNYTVTPVGGCTTTTATGTITVTSAPSAGTLSGNQNVCLPSGTTTFTSTVSGGTWSSSAPAIATINSSTGVVTAVSAGTATMTYTVAGSGGCANATATRTATVATCGVQCITTNPNISKKPKN